MAEEGAGPQVAVLALVGATPTPAGIIPSDFFMDSEACGECHKDIYQQWKSSMHHFASFNNQFYRSPSSTCRTSSGTQGSKWCAGCHDHAVFFNGRFDRPIKEQIDTPEAQNGLGCVSCHSIVHVDSTMGNGGFTMEYPPLHDSLPATIRCIRAARRFHDLPEPEAAPRDFHEAFHARGIGRILRRLPQGASGSAGEHYRWLRGFNEYDNWQASGVSGQGARSFYYPPKSQTCADCHMPLVPSHDPGNRDGKVHSHRFAAANTAVAYVNHDEVQLKATEKISAIGLHHRGSFRRSAGRGSTAGEVQMRAAATDAAGAGVHLRGRRRSRADRRRRRFARSAKSPRRWTHRA